jgi:Uma2 family endonuclease
MTYADYVALEQKGDVKHEFIRGDVFAMAGGTPDHAALAMAIGRQLGNALEGKPCRVFSSDLRVRVKATDFAAYPDVTVVCGKLEADTEDSDAATNPKLIVEVLSDATEAYDRGAKAAQYRRIAALEEYVLVQGEPMIEVYRRNERGKWELTVEAGRGQTATLASVGATLNVDAVYANPLA